MGALPRGKNPKCPEMPAAAARYVALYDYKSYDGAGIWSQDHWLSKRWFRLISKEVSAYNSKTVGWACHFHSKNQNQNIPAFLSPIYCFLSIAIIYLLLSPMNLVRRTFWKWSSITDILTSSKSHAHCPCCHVTLDPRSGQGQVKY